MVGSHLFLLQFLYFLPLGWWLGLLVCLFFLLFFLSVFRDLLMEVDMYELRTAICGDKGDLARFRQLVINAVMATDIADKELGALRKKRWEKAFNTSSISPDHQHDEQTIREDNNRKATIVIEHLIQASDVSHT